MAIYIYFVTAPYAAPGVIMAMLFFFSVLLGRCLAESLSGVYTASDIRTPVSLTILLIFF